MKNRPLSATLVALAVLAVLVYKNPTSDDFQSFASAYITENLTPAETKENGAANVLGVAGAMVAAKSTKRTDFILFSRYSGEGAGYRWSVVGLAGNFVPLQVERLSPKEDAVAEAGQSSQQRSIARAPSQNGSAPPPLMPLSDRSNVEPAPVAPSFDCGQAKLPGDLLVCSDWRLAARDQAISNLYTYRQKLSVDRSALKEEQITWVKNKSACTNRDCAAALYDQRYADLFQAGREAMMAARDVVEVGDCMVDRVSSVGPRLEHGTDGTAFRTERGKFGVDYETIVAAWNSKPGDEVLVCLKSVEQECPTGDARGKVHFFYNLGTRQAWTMQDSQHGCGGA